MAVLFSALAAEAYVNEFIAAKMPPKDVEALDRLPTPDKYTDRRTDGRRDGTI